MKINPKIRTQRALGNFDFNVSILTLDGGEKEKLRLGVDQVTGLGGAQTNLVQYRDGGQANTSYKFLPGLAKAEVCTMSGIVVADAQDLLELQEWDAECKGKKLSTAIGGYYRTIVIQHLARNDDKVDLFSQEVDVKLKAKFTLSNCMCVGFKIADFDVNSQNFSKYTLSVAYQDCKVG